MAAHPPPAMSSKNWVPPMLGVQWGLFAGATIFVALRFHVRVIMRKTFGWDDFWMLLAWVTALFMSIIMQLNIDAGYGHAGSGVRDGRDVLYYTAIAQLGVSWGITFVKLSVVAFVLRMVAKSPKMRLVRWLCWINVAIFLPMTFAVFFVFAFQCIPLKAYWREGAPPDKCLKPQIIINVVIAYSAAGAASDLLTGIIPIFIIRGLQLPPRQKLGLCIMAGMVAGIAGLAIMKAVVASRYDPTSGAALMAIAASAEHEAGIIVACLPAMPALYTQLKQSYSTYRSQRKLRTDSSSAVTLTNNDDSGMHDKKSISIETVSNPNSTASLSGETPPTTAHRQSMQHSQNADNTIYRTIEVNIDHTESDDRTWRRHESYTGDRPSHPYRSPSRQV